MVSATQFGKESKHTQKIPKRSTETLKDCEIGFMRNG